MRVGRKQRRRRRQRRQFQRAILLLAPVVLTVTSLALPTPAFTHAMLANPDPVSTITIRSLSTDEALKVDAETLHLEVTEDEPVGQLTILSVRNTSGRTLHLTAALIGVDDLKAHSAPVTLRSGDSSEVWLTGKALQTGLYTATLNISAMGGYLQKAIAVEVTVLPKKVKLKRCLPGTEPKKGPESTEPTPTPDQPAPTDESQPLPLEEPTPPVAAPEADPVPGPEPGVELPPAVEPLPDLPGEGTEPGSSEPAPGDDPIATIPVLDPNVDWVDCSPPAAPAVPPTPAPGPSDPVPPAPTSPTPTEPVPPPTPVGEQPKSGEEQKVEPKPEAQPQPEPQPQPEDQPEPEAQPQPESQPQPPSETNAPPHDDTTSKGDR